MSLMKVVQRYDKCDECGAPIYVREDLFSNWGKVLVRKIPFVIEGVHLL